MEESDIYSHIRDLLFPDVHRAPATASLTTPPAPNGNRAPASTVIVTGEVPDDAIALLCQPGFYAQTIAADRQDLKLEEAA
tara:strand:+ start:18928 stop:19170 length:243 start_codon:yes stop_codon:yes gene_type:complete